MSLWFSTERQERKIDGGGRRGSEWEGPSESKDWPRLDGVYKYSLWRGGGRKRETDRQTGRQAGRQTGRQQVGRQADRQTDRQRQTERDRDDDDSDDEC